MARRSWSPGATACSREAPRKAVPFWCWRRGARRDRGRRRHRRGPSFSDLSWPIDTETDRFRARGGDQKELTLTELWRRARAPRESKPTAAEIGAELHSRLVLIASVLLLPLLAAPLAIAGPVRSRRGGIVVGLLILIVYYETLNFGDTMAKRELLAPQARTLAALRAAPWNRLASAAHACAFNTR